MGNCCSRTRRTLLAPLDPSKTRSMSVVEKIQSKEASKVEEPTLKVQQVKATVSARIYLPAKVVQIEINKTFAAAGIARLEEILQQHKERLKPWIKKEEMFRI